MAKVVLLDGGLGQEVHKRSGKPAHPLWSAKVMMDTPEIVKEVHKDFIKSGAKVIIINSYTATPTRLRRDGQADWFETLQRQALKIAREARAELGAAAENVQIAGCLPPLVGSYTTDDRTFEQLKNEYSQITEVQSSGVDLFIAETISSIKEAKAAVAAALETGKPTLLSFTLSDEEPGKLRSGEAVETAVSELAGENLSALLFNCSFPETIANGLAAVQHLDIPFGGYANGFTSVEALKPGGTVDSLSARTDLDEEKYANYVMEWIKQGATIVGGCCEVGPSYIAHLSKKLSENGYEVGSLTS